MRPRLARYASVHSPYASSNRSHTSLTVGKEGIACHNVSRGASATIAIVAEWKQLLDVGAGEGGADEGSALLVDDELACPLDAVPRV